MQIENLYTIYLQHPSIQTDTRKIKKDDFLFLMMTIEKSPFIINKLGTPHFSPE